MFKQNYLDGRSRGSYMYVATPKAMREVGVGDGGDGGGEYEHTVCTYTYSLCLVVLDGRNNSYTAHRTLVCKWLNHSNLILILIKKRHVMPADEKLNKQKVSKHKFIWYSNKWTKEMKKNCWFNIRKWVLKLWMNK